MMIANRLVVFLVILLTNYACQNLAPTVKEKTERDDTGGFPVRDHCSRILVERFKFYLCFKIALSMAIKWSPIW